MADRTDIDALLIGALYGELTPADEARLTAHLASHPADRTALEDLTHTRDAVRAIGLRTTWLEPPQAVSARVLQEAARRAKPAESWFQRFVRSLTAHPALAAAMTIVIIAGVASTLYLRRDPAAPAEQAEDHELAMVTPQSAARAAAPAPAIATPPGSPVVAAVPPPPPPANTHAAAGSGTFAEGDAARATGAKDKSELLAFRDVAKDEKVATPAKPTARAKSRPTGIAVERDEPQPKDLDDARTMGKLAQRDDSVGRRQVNAGLVDGYATPPAAVAAAPAGAGGPPAEIAADKASDGAVIGWAQRQRDQVIAYVRANNCRAAATAAVEIYNRAPDFYASNIAIDREVKPCLPYVTSERERVDRARAAKRGNTETVSPSDPSTTAPATPPVRN
jgi:hypothetical protein